MENPKLNEIVRCNTFWEAIYYFSLKDPLFLGKFRNGKIQNGLRLTDCGSHQFKYKDKHPIWKIPKSTRSYDVSTSGNSLIISIEGPLSKKHIYTERDASSLVQFAPASQRKHVESEASSPILSSWCLYDIAV